MGKNWRLAKSLVTLREQINKAYPQRDKTSDGSIGDTSHSARKSDHNPNGAGVVCAIDIDEDLSSLDGIHTLLPLVAAIQKSRDPRVNYIIYEGRITVKGSNLQLWKGYSGVNAHKHHAHISVFQNPKLYDDDSPWSITMDIPPAKSESELYIVQPGDTLWQISSSFKVPLETLWTLNNMSTGDSFIRAGQKLRVK